MLPVRGWCVVRCFPRAYMSCRSWQGLPTLARRLSAEAAAGSGLSRSEVLDLVQELKRDQPADEEAMKHQSVRLATASPDLQRYLIDGSIMERLKLLGSVADLGTISGRPFANAIYMLVFLEEYSKVIESLRDGETISQRSQELREVLLCFHRTGLSPDRLKLLYSHIEHDFPRFEAAGALLPMKDAVMLCHTMLATGLSAPGAVTVLLRSALREPLLYVADDSLELRLLKAIEMLIRVDFLYTQEQLPPEVTEYLGLVRDLRFYDRELRRDTLLSYQLAFFLRKHGFPAKRKMLGPYALKVCDPEERINFEPVEERNWRFGLVEVPTGRKKRHLEALGWRSIEVKASSWKTLEDYDAKAAYIRNLLKENELLTL